MKRWVSIFLLATVLAWTPARTQTPGFAEELDRLQKLMLAGEYTRVEQEAQILLKRFESMHQMNDSLQVALLLDIRVEAMLRMQPPGKEPDPTVTQTLRPLVERAHGIKRRLLDPNDPEMAITLLNMGAVLLREGEPGQARRLFQTALDIREKSFGGEHSLVGESAYYVGLALIDSGKLDEAVLALERALSIWERAFGPEHPMVATTLAKLAELAWNAGDYDEAERLYGRNLRIMEKSYGPGHPAVAAVRNRLGSLYLAQGDLAGFRALGFALAADLVQHQKTLGPGLGADWREDYAKGEEALRRQEWGGVIQNVIRAIEKKAGSATDYHPYLKLGIAFYNLGELDKARSAFENEMTLGAIQNNPSALNNLETFRKLVATAKPQGVVDKPVAEIIERSLDRARALETQGKLDEALVALGEALAVAPDNSQVDRAMQALRGRLAEQVQERELERRVGELVKNGAALFAAGDYQQASSVLSQALSLKPGVEAQALLAQSQEKLAERIEAEQDVRSRRARIEGSLAKAAELEQRGETAEALSRLQEVLAVDPSNRAGLEIRDRLFRREAETESRRSRTESVTRLFEEGGQLLRDGIYHQAAGRFSRILALDPENEDAAERLRQALDGMAQSLLSGPVSGVKVPPSIVLANLATATDDAGAAEEHVSSPSFTLAGIIDDDQPEVTLQIRQGASGGGHVIHEATLQSDKKRGELYRHNFQRTIELAPGLASLAVTVTDADGLGDEVIHRVRYLRPWSRSPWSYLLVGLLVLSCAATVHGVRVRRRNRLLKRRFNPYAAGAPIFDEKMFFGREALLARILQTIPNNSVLLYGERRIGKTSLQHQLRKRLEQLDDPTYKFYPVYTDLEGTPEQKFFSLLAHDIFDALAPVLNGERPGAGLPAGERYDYQALVRDIRKVLKALREDTDKKVKLALLIDEVDELNEYDPRINQRLRSLFMKSFAEELVAVVSGVGIKKNWEREGSPWFNFFEEIQVVPFAIEHAKALIEQPVRGVFEFQDGAVERIIERGAQKPYLIQKMCIELVNRMHEEGRRKITLDDVEATRQPVVD